VARSQQYFPCLKFCYVHQLSIYRPLLRLFALIIGINKYDSVNHLYGAVPDANAVQDYLQNDLGVPSSQIKNLRDSEATRVGITGEIETFLINNDNIKKGDPILIYYAGHGGWKKAPTGWQTGGTGNIQLLIPCDYSDRPEAGDRQHGIPDRTFGALVSRLANKQGDNIVRQTFVKFRESID
jgi:Caspase domain